MKKSKAGWGVESGGAWGGDIAVLARVFRVGDL